MADKKPEVTAERIYTIPLRKTWVKTRRVARAKKCIRVIREYAMKHMHVKEVSISPKVSEQVWHSGPKKPPGRITVKVTVAAGRASVRLPGEITLEEEKKKFIEAAKKKDSEKKAAGRAEEAVENEAAVIEKAAEEAKAEPAAEEKEPVKEEKKAEEKKDEKSGKEKPKKAAAKKQKSGK